MKKGKKKSWIKGMLCAAFAATLLIPTGKAAPLTPPPDAPAAIAVFNQNAAYAPPSYGNLGGNFNQKWQNMLSRHKKELKDPAVAAAYQKFLAQFDDLKGKPLTEQAREVTRRINDYMTWTSDGTGSADYWQDSIETLRRGGLGDCEDHAIMKYFVMRHLGVPDSRLFVATVNDKGGGSVDHAVLLLNVSADPQTIDGKTSFVILDNENSRLVNTADSGYSFFGAQNANGFWFTGHVAPVLLRPPVLAVLPDKIKPKNTPNKLI